MLAGLPRSRRDVWPQPRVELRQAGFAWRSDLSRTLRFSAPCTRVINNLLKLVQVQY
jgi:hypothetical protein